jgi:cardiolipin synthase (CMP-forming)
LTDPSVRMRRILERRRKERPERRLLTVPNVISLIRLIGLMPLFVVVVLVWHSPGWGLIVAIVLGATDFLDGYIARRFHQVTLLGKALDPIADRISQIVVSVTLVIGGYLPLWMAIVVGAADLLFGTALILRARAPIPVRWIGRIRTALLMIGLPLVLLFAALAPSNEPLAFAALAVVGSGVILHAIADVTYTVSLIHNTANNVRDAHPVSD